MPGTEETSEPNAPKHRLAFGLVAVVLLLVLYVLSIGPVAWIFFKAGHFNSSAGERFFQVFYAPLDWVYQHNDWFKSFIDAYIKLFHIS